MANQDEQSESELNIKNLNTLKRVKNNKPTDFWRRSVPKRKRELLQSSY